MTVFVDTSALLAVIVAADTNHRVATDAWNALLDDDRMMRTHAYVVVETTALLQHRYGMRAVRTLQLDVLPVLSVRYVDAELHARAAAALLAARKRSVSLVDRVSFDLMREEHLVEAFAFDRDFLTEGFELLV